MYVHCKTYILDLGKWMLKTGGLHHRFHCTTLPKDFPYSLCDFVSRVKQYWFERGIVFRGIPSHHAITLSQTQQ